MKRILYSAALILGLAWSPARADDLVRDAVSTTSGRYTAGPSLVAGAGEGSAYSQFQYIPPATATGVKRSFWDLVYQLERKHVAYGYSQGRQALVEDIRGDLESMTENDRLDMMRRFLAVAHHYRGKAGARNAPEVRRFHQTRFEAEVQDFAARAKRELIQRQNPVLMEFFSHLRALAAAGPEGLQLSQELAAVFPEHAVVLGNLAQDFMNVGDDRKAVEASEKSIRLDPQRSQPFTILASAKYAGREFEASLEAADRALALEPGDRVAFNIQKMARQQLYGTAQEPMSSEDITADALVSGLTPPGSPMPPSAAAGLIQLARGEFRKGSYDKTVLYATQALEKDPDDAAALTWRAFANVRRDKLKEALADTEAALRVSGAEPGSLLLNVHARVHNRLGRFAEAMAAAEQALAVYEVQAAQGKEPSVRGLAGAHFQKAWALAGLDRAKEAKQSLAKAARVDGKYVQYYQAALDLPEDADMALLFSKEWFSEDRGAAGRAAGAAGNAAESKDTRRRMLLILVLSVAGGFLIALGLLHSMSWGRKAAGAPATPVPGGLIAGTYRLERKIGVGGMGVVFEAFDVNLERRVAIKRMREEIGHDARERERFVSEARTVAALKHPNIVEIHSVVGDGDDIYLVFEYVDGSTVDEYIRSYGKLPFDQSVRIIQAVTSALEYSHKRGVIHRDLKPANIMINKDGIVKVMDFGVARQAKDSLSSLQSTSTITGTPQYMAPEQELGHVRRESDVYAMAVCFYEMVTGTLPFQGTSGGISLGKQNRNYIRAGTRVEGLHPFLDQVLDWALDPDPEKRCKTPAKFAQSLESLL
ncbi:MAG: hypothetical protein A2X36_00170 [Elusimicrobia bacterium GWA2_69_24]|nr:MAG: hypothetical protein A2X36_00170 [Elusimicrobia bacterium GWA2_69_24]HBL17280.1 hypothetical protein [Elusimicrobiota bacterium]